MKFFLGYLREFKFYKEKFFVEKNFIGLVEIVEQIMYLVYDLWYKICEMRMNWKDLYYVLLLVFEFDEDIVLFSFEILGW